MKKTYGFSVTDFCSKKILLKKKRVALHLKKLAQKMFSELRKSLFWVFRNYETFPGKKKFRHSSPQKLGFLICRARVKAASESYGISIKYFLAVHFGTNSHKSALSHIQNTLLKRFFEPLAG